VAAEPAWATAVEGRPLPPLTAVDRRSASACPGCSPPP